MAIGVSYTIVFLSAPALALGLFLLWRLLQQKRLVLADDTIASQEKSDAVDPYIDIEPLPYTDLSIVEPIKIRPFKPKYHLTMALENCPLSEYLAFDKTYLERMKIRKSIMDEHLENVYDCDPKCEAAVMEIYEWMFATYLPKRLPALFKLVKSHHLPPGSKMDGGSYLHNKVTGEYIPLRAPSARAALYTLGKNVDDDILILLPSSEANDGSPIYHLQAYVCCCPSGFSLPEKFRLPLASIHQPVPSYKAKLEKSMDRFFAKLETGKAVRRANWTITTHDKLFTQKGNHLYANGQAHEPTATEGGSGANQKTLDVNAPGLDDTIAQQKKEVEIEKCRLRCERQTLHRLPQTQALVFSFKTYLYTLDEVKAEGSAEDLAAAIKGMSLGNAPEMAYYKRAVVWGDPVIEYLRS